MRIRWILLVLVVSWSAAVGSEAPGVDACEGIEDRDVQPIERPFPAYPAQAGMFCIEGHARFEFTIREDGTVGNVEVIEGVPDGVFDGAAQVFEFWRFTPRCVGGEAVSRTATQRVDFAMDPRSRADCPDRLPASAIPLQAELFALYQHHQEQLFDTGRLDIRETPTLGMPHAPIERAYRRFLIEQTAWGQSEIEPLMVAARTVIGSPPVLDRDDLVERIGFLRAIDDELRAAPAEWRRIVDRFIAELRAAADSVDLEPEVRTVFVDRLIQDPEAMRGTMGVAFEPVIELLAREIRIAEWLHEHSHEVEFAPSGLRFASERLEAAFLELLNARDDALNDVQYREALEMMRWELRDSGDQSPGR